MVIYLRQIRSAANVAPLLFSRSTKYTIGSAATPILLAQRSLASLAEQFSQAQSTVKTFSEDPGNEQKLKLYALFKQASSGQAKGSRPGMMDFVNRAKWDAWNELGQMSQDEAMSAYVSAVNELAKSQGQGQETSPASPAADGDGQTELGPDAKFIQLEKIDNVYHIRINRPDKLNSLRPDMYRAITRALYAAGKMDDVSVTVISSTGDGYYSSGNDLSFFMKAAGGDMDALIKEGHELFRDYVRAFLDHPKLLITLVQGPAVGIAVTSLGLCDAVIASDKATFHAPFPSLGQTPEGCSTVTFPAMMGHLRAAEVLLLGRKIDAVRAERYNLVTEVIAHDQFYTESAARVQQYAQLPPKTLCISKGLMRQQDKQHLIEVNELEAATLAKSWKGAECHQAIMNFFSRGKK